MSKITEILDRVRAQSTVVASVIKLITDLRIAIGEAIDANDMAALQTLRLELDTNTDALAAALIAGTELDNGPSGEDTGGEDTEAA